MDEARVGILGAGSLVSQYLLSRLREAGSKVLAVSRHPPEEQCDAVWIRADQEKWPTVPFWISAAPIWVLSDYLDRMRASGALRIVVLSTTSLFTKRDSADAHERRLAQKIVAAERVLQSWARTHVVEWTILRPTLIYGKGQDKNISEIARFVRRFHFFPLAGRAAGLRQPVHAEDVATACLSALHAQSPGNRAYNLSGGETIAYSEMVRRIFVALGRRPRMVSIPCPVFRATAGCARMVPRCRQWSPALAERMNRDLVFDHTDALLDLGFSPRLFNLTTADLP